MIDAQANRRDKCRNAGGELDNKCLHRENDALVAAVVFQLAVIDRVRKKHSRDDGQHAVCREDEECGNKEEKDAAHAGKRQNKQDGIADDGHGQTDVKDLKRSIFFAKQGIEGHHGKDLDRAAEHVEENIGVVPTGRAEVILEKVNNEVRGNVDRAVDQHDRNRDSHCLVVLDQSLEHLTDRDGLHLGGGLLLDVYAGQNSEKNKEESDHDREVFKTDDLDHLGTCIRSCKHIAEHRDEHHRKDRDDRAADAGAGTGDRSKTLTFLATLGKGGYHGPVGDIHHRVSNAPENVGNSRIGDKTGGIKLRRSGEHKYKNDSICQRADQKPGPEFSPPRPGFGDDHAHDRVVKGVKNTSSHQNDAHCDGIDAEQVLEIVQDIAGGKHVNHIFSDSAERIGDF